MYDESHVCAFSHEFAAMVIGGLQLSGAEVEGEFSALHADEQCMRFDGGSYGRGCEVLDADLPSHSGHPLVERWGDSLEGGVFHEGYESWCGEHGHISASLCGGGVALRYEQACSVGESGSEHISEE